MQINLDQIRDHAEQRLADPPPETAERIASFKRFLKLETERLRMRHRFGLGGRLSPAVRTFVEKTLEFCRDFSDTPFFNDEDGALKKGRNTLTLGVVYAFGTPVLTESKGEGPRWHPRTF